MANWHYAQLTVCPLEIMANWQYGKLTVNSLDIMANWQYGHLTDWWCSKLWPEWQTRVGSRAASRKMASNVGSWLVNSCLIDSDRAMMDLAGSADCQAVDTWHTWQHCTVCPLNALTISKITLTFTVCQYINLIKTCWGKFTQWHNQKLWRLFGQRWSQISVCYSA